MIFSLACQTACDGWRNVDYVTEAAKFFSYWTFMPWIIVTYTGLSVIDGILGTGINLSLVLRHSNVMHLGRMLITNHQKEIFLSILIISCKEYVQSHSKIQVQ